MTIRQQTEQIEQMTLSPFAALAQNTQGRDVPEQPCPIRTDYQRDRDRILHSKSFRRLMNKTQVFLTPEGDHYRTRLTHTLEVCQISRTVARGLRLNEDLTEAIALGHDLGHTPFGHAGEEVLNQVCPYGYRHSVQSVRVVETLENSGRGLNLTKEVRNGILCHSNGVEADTLEGRVVRYGDKIAYMNHDIDDAVRGGVLSPEDIPWNVQCHLGRTRSQRITALVTSLIQNSGEQIAMDEQHQALYNELRTFLFQAVYTNPQAKGEEGKAKAVVEQMYHYFIKHSHRMPAEYQEIMQQTDPHRAVCDYISGMSDRYCISLYESLFIPRSWHISDDLGEKVD